MLIGTRNSSRLTDLRFDSMLHLKSSCEVVGKNKALISRLASKKAFTHVERLFDEAKLRLREGDEEQAYQLFTRMGTVSDIIIRKNDFGQFKNTPDGRRFYDLFKQCISQLNDLEESLVKRYELKEVEKNYGPTEAQSGSINNGTNQNNVPGGPLTIEPRELMHYVDRMHQVLIIDYRNDQTEIVQPLGTGRLLVAQVPADAIVPGWVLALANVILFIVVGLAQSLLSIK